MSPLARLPLILLLAPCLALAQTTQPADAPDKQTDYNKIIDNFFVDLKAQRFTDAAHVLIDTNQQDTFNVDKHASLAVPLEKISDTFGNLKVFEPVVSKTLGDGIGYVYGIAVYEKSPIRYEFIFYKEGDYWRLLHIDFNLNYVPELRDLAGIQTEMPPVYAPAPGQPAPGARPVAPQAPPPAPAPMTPTPSSPPPTPSAPESTNPPPPSSPAPVTPSPAPSTNAPAPAPTH